MDNGYYLLMGKFDISKYDSNIKTVTNDVVLTNERLSHIIDKHPEVLIYLNKLSIFFNSPDMVCLQLDKQDTIWIVKKISENLKITIKLSTVKMNDANYKNSIIQMQYMNDKELNRNVSIGKVKVLWSKNIALMQEVC